MAIELGIGANIDGLKSALKSGIVATNQFEKSVVTSAGRAEAALSKNSAAVRGAKKDYTNLNRVIQDAPFGLMGIANNLQTLIPNIGALSIGINLLMTAVLFAQNGFGAWTRGIGDNKKAIDNSKLAGDEYIKTLNQVTQARLKGNQQAVEELTTLKLLYGQSQNENLSKKQRLEAVNELQKQYPAYFKNISDEAILAGNAKSAYDKLATAILATARARAATDLITQNTQRQLEDEQKIIDLRQKRIGLDAKLSAAEKIDSQSNSGTSSLTGGAGNIVTAQKLYGVKSEIEKIDRAIYNLTTDKNKLDAKNLQLIKSVNDEVERGAKLSGNVGSLETAKNNPRREALNFADNYTGLAELEKQVRERMQKGLIEGSAKTQIKPVEFEIKPTFAPSTLATAGEVFKEYFEYDLLPQLSSSFDNFFNDILEKGEFSFKSLGQSIKKTFASVLASEATNGLLKLLGAKGKSMEGKGGLFPALAGLLGKGSGAAAGAASTAGAGAAGAGGILAGFSPAALAIGGTVIAGSLIANIVKGINKNKTLPNLYGENGTSFIGESRSRGQDLLQTWYRTQKRKGR